MGEDSTSRVSMLAAGGTFIAGTADALVATARATKHRKNASEHVSEDLLNRQIQVHGLVSPERAKNVVWFFFRKYNSKKLEGPDNLKLSQHALCTICLEDITRRRLCTVQMGKDNSPSSLLDHMRTHHLEEFNAVVLATHKGVPLATFTAEPTEKFAVPNAGLNLLRPDSGCPLRAGTGHGLPGRAPGRCGCAVTSLLQRGCGGAVC